MGVGLVTLAVAAAVIVTVVSGAFNSPVARTANDTSASEIALSLPRCHATQLRVWDYTPPYSAADYGVIVVRLKNVSALECSLSGYPSVQGINQWNGAVDPATAPVQALEVTPDKKIVWALRAWGNPVNLGPSTTIQLLDTPSVPEAVHFGDLK